MLRSRTIDVLKLGAGYKELVDAHIGVRARLPHLHREVVLRLPDLSGLQVNALLLVVNGVAIYDEYTPLLILVLVGFGYLELLVLKS